MNNAATQSASTETPVSADLDRAEAIARIRTALRARSGRAWSVKGNSGTAWGWINISAPPSRCDEFGRMTRQDQDDLAKLLDMKHLGSRQGVSVPASGAYRREYVERAEGRPVTAIAVPYWD